MASRQVYAILAMIMAVLPATTLAKVFVVGDEHGWTINFDYKLWAAGKDFRVGDKLGNLSHHCLFLCLFLKTCIGIA